MKVKCLTSGGLADGEIRSNNELQEVSRGHSTGKTGRTEQFVVFLLPIINIDDSQNVLMRRVRAYLGGLLKIDDLSTCDRRGENEYGAFRRNTVKRKPK